MDSWTTQPRRTLRFIFMTALCLELAAPSARVIALAAQAGSASYYVNAATGSDSNSGTSTSDPWKTIQNAFNSATPGSTVHIKAGIYKERLTLNVSGSATAGFITFRNYESDTVILDATGISASPLINITDRRYVRLQGFNIVNYVSDAGIAISISGGSDHVEIRQNRLSNIRIASGTRSWNVPIRITGDAPTRPNSAIVIDGNELSNCDVGWGEGLTVAANSANWEITNNRLVQCSGIDAQGHFKESSDPGTDQARNGVIRGNVVSDSGADGVGIYVDGAKDVVAANLALARVGDKKPRRTTP